MYTAWVSDGPQPDASPLYSPSARLEVRLPGRYCSPLLVTATLWFFAYQRRDTAYAVLFPVYVILAVHGWYLGSRLPDL